jgi:putative hydrolase of the HAD superfamily
MVRIEVVSFDLEGTLVDLGLSNLVWETDIPRLFAECHGLSFEEARERVIEEYRQVGDDQPEWYDVDYWFRRLDLPGDWRELLELRRNSRFIYPEVRGVLDRLRGRYSLVISSNTIREFLEVQLSELEDYFEHVFSAPSDFGTVKKSKEFYGRICHIMEVEPRVVVHVGDSLRFDYEEAKKRGIHAFHLDRYRKSEGDHVVHDLIEFEERLRTLERG